MDLFSCIFTGGFQQLAQQLINGLAKGSIYALVALGYTMIYGIVELINFAHGDIFMLGSFISLALVNAMGVTGVIKGDIFAVILVLLAALAGTMLLTGLIGITV